MGEKKSMSLVFVSLVVSLWLIMGSRVAFAQTLVMSDILGQVNDPSGAAVAGATVTARDQNTGFTRTSESDASGAYLVHDLVSGLYTVSVEKSGFKRYVRTDLDLTASKKLRVDVTLEVGRVTQAITVKGGTPLIETETSTVSLSARNSVINELPEAGSSQGGRILYTFFYYTPGTSSSVGNTAFDGLPSGAGADRITLDGIRTPESCCQQQPSMEAVEEIKVTEHNSPAEYKTPSTVEQITRSGTNRFHGDGWELYDDKGLEARNPFLPVKQLFHGHTFGGSIGGPIKKDKAFFYFGFEEFRFANLSVTVSPISQFNVPTTKMQHGDFSELLDPNFVNTYNGGHFVAVKNPFTGQPFPGNIIPANDISPVSQYFVNKFWSTPTAPGIVNNEFINALHPYTREKYDWRVDYNISSRHTIFARYGMTAIDGHLSTVGFSYANNFNRQQLFPGRTAGFSDTFIFNPHVTNEFRFGFDRTRLAFSSPYDNATVLGSAGLQNAAAITGLPGIAFTNFSGLSATTFSQSVDQVKGVTDNLSIFSGKHNLKMGVLFNRADVFSSVFTNPPSFSFTGALSGWDFADFMLGDPSSVTRSLGNSGGYLFQNEFGVYVEDSFKLKPNLTLQYGVRYDLQPYLYEKYDKIAMYDIPKQAIVVASQSSMTFVNPSWPTSTIPILTPSQAGWPASNRSLINDGKNGISPRFGFAWRPRSREDTVVRGGYGVYRYSPVSRFAGGPSQSLFSGTQSATQSLVNGILTPTISWPNSFAGFGSASSLNPATLSFTTSNPNLNAPAVQEYSLSVEHQYRGWGVRGSYFGSFETGIIYGSNYNEVPPSTQPFAQNLRPIPNAFNITLYQNGGFSRVNGFQTEVRHPTAHGLLFDGSWTWMKCLGDVTSTGLNDTPVVPALGTGGYYDRRRFESNCDFETRQQALFTYVYTLPFGHGQKYLSGAPAIVNGILGGWRLVGATEFQTGWWLTPYYIGINPAGMAPGVGSNLPDRVGNGNYPRSQRNGLTAPYFDSGAFACPGGSTIGGQANLLSAGCPLSTPQNVGRLGNSATNILEGPGTNTWNLAIIKQFPLGHREGTNLEVSAQIANPWNHPTYQTSPSANLSSTSTFGRITATREDYVQPWSYGFRKISLMGRINF